MIEALQREISSMSSEEESNSENGSIANSSEDLVSRLKDPDWNANMELECLRTVYFTPFDISKTRSTQSRTVFYCKQIHILQTISTLKYLQICINIKLTNCIDLKFPFDLHTQNRNYTKTSHEHLQTSTTVKYQQLYIGSYMSSVKDMHQ